MKPDLSFLVKGNDWQTLLYLEINPALQLVARQIIICPDQGTTKQIYLQGKAIELITLQLAPILVEQSNLQRSLD